MNKIFLIVFIILLVAIGGYFVGKNALYKPEVESQDTVNDFVEQQQPFIQNEEQPIVVGESVSVNIQGFKFIPADLVIAAGTTVIWTNNDSVPHDIQIGNFTSPIFTKGETFQFKFDNPGIFDYICGLHPAMKGKITVQ